MSLDLKHFQQTYKVNSIKYDSIEKPSKKSNQQRKMSNSKTIKNRKLQIATFKHIAVPSYELLQNEQQKQFNQTYNKQSTIDKINALQFQNDNHKCRALVDCLLKDYELWHPETLTAVPDSVTDTDNQAKIYNEIKQNGMDGIVEYENENNVNETQSSNIKLKSNIIFLQLQNKKLELKEKLLEKKYQKESLQVKMAPNMEIILRKREKQLLEIQLNLLKQVKELSQKLQDLKKPVNSFLILDINSNSYGSNCQNAEKPQKKKKINKVKLLKYLLQKVQMINSKDEFLQLLDKTQASLLNA